MTRATLTRLIAAMLVLTAVISVAMLQVDWNGLAASEEAHQIDTLTDVMIVLSAFVYAIVLVMLGYSIWRYRARPGDESDGEPIHGNTRLEVAWTLIPTVIVLFGAAYSWIVLDDIEARGEAPMEIEVTAQQFAWKFEYPEQRVTSNELHVPVGQQVEFKLDALDVIHSFWVPEWRLKQDAVPGQPTDVVVTPDREGRYALVCAELCGVGHATMRAPVVVESREEFDRWLEQEGGRATAGGAPVQQPKQAAASEEGAQLFETEGCGSCHALAAAGTTGDIGPDLDEALVDSSPGQIRESIIDPDAEASRGFQVGIMPDTFAQSLDDEQLDALVDYLMQSAQGGQEAGGQAGNGRR